MSKVKKSNVHRPCGRPLTAVRTAGREHRSNNQGARRVQRLSTFDFLTFDKFWDTKIL